MSTLKRVFLFVTGAGLALLGSGVIALGSSKVLTSATDRMLFTIGPIALVVVGGCVLVAWWFSLED